MKVLIDAGHGGKDGGGGTNSYFKEKDMTLQITLYQLQRLRDLGVEVDVTRHSDICISPEDRSRMVRQSGATICISNHINNAGNVRASGAETIHSIHSNGKLARLVADHIKQAGMPLRRVFTRTLPNNPNVDYYFMHRETGKVETVIVEYGFASNVKDTNFLVSNWKELAEATIAAICEYIGIPYDRKGDGPMLEAKDGQKIVDLLSKIWYIVEDYEDARNEIHRLANEVRKVTRKEVN